MPGLVRTSTLFFVAFAAVTPTAFADRQNYPVRPVRLIVPFAPGGSTDILARLVGRKLGERLGQQFVVDNRPGAGGNIGVDIASKAPRDAYTLVLVTVAFAINASLHQKLPFDPRKDLAPLALVASAPNLLVVHPSLPVKSVSELVALAKQTKGSLNYASAGIGTPTHLAAELFNALTGAGLVHVPYKGGGPALTDLTAGQVKVMFPGIISGLGHVKTGRLRALAVTSSTRSKAAADIPTIVESGVPNYEAVNWYALLAPAGIPKPIVQRLNLEVNEVLGLPDVAELLARDGAEPVRSTPVEASRHIAAEIEKWRKVVAQSGASVQ